MGIEPFRAKQLMLWLYKKGATTFDEMANIPRDVREKLKSATYIEQLRFVKEERSSERGTAKYVFRTHDGALIETVKLSSKTNTTLCVSSQAGCPLKCAFCATGRGGFKRNLTAGEILSQILYFVKKDRLERPNIVFMGMGEPLLNYQNLMKAVHIINSPDGLNTGIRRLTVSTCGLSKEIRKLAGEKLEINLSVSLNAPNDAVRNRIMPVNRKYPISDLLKAVKYYIQNTNRRVTFDYVMLKGINDSIKDAKQLSSLLQDFLCHVNLIPYNKVSGCALEGSSRERVELFRQILAHSGVNATIRKSRGSDISAACGQLAGK